MSAIPLDKKCVQFDDGTTTTERLPALVGYPKI